MFILWDRAIIFFKKDIPNPAISPVHAWGRVHQGEDHQEGEAPCAVRLQPEQRASTGAEAAGASPGGALLRLFFAATFGAAPFLMRTAQTLFTLSAPTPNLIIQANFHLKEN